MDDEEDMGGNDSNEEYEESAEKWQYLRVSVKGVLVVQ